MSGTWGKNVNISIFGESHGIGIGVVINGIEAGFEIDMDKVAIEMERRAPGRNSLSTPRKEADKPEILSGVFQGVTTGTPICMIIRNGDTRSKDYSKTKNIMRPSHGDFTGYVKYNGFNDYRGGGHFSGRITAPLVFVGAIAKQILEKKNIFVGSHIKQINNVMDESFDSINLRKSQLEQLLAKELPVISDKTINMMKEEILLAKSVGDSVGGVVECGIIGLKAGVGDPFFDSLESTISHLAFSVPAIKGIEFGIGFGFASQSGKTANDQYYVENGNVKTFTNNNGGITGGISNGMPVIFRCVVKPTPSIALAQKSFNIETMENEELKIVGRHDPCIVQRALVVLESVAAISVLERL